MPLLTRADPECPVLAGPARAQFLAAAKASNAFSEAVLDFLQKKTAPEQAAWLRVSVDSGRAIFQPWCLELLYVLAVRGRARFSGLQGLLGLSSRTLSDKLHTLREEGFIDREIFDERPIRIEYFPTRHGRRTAALASPLFAHLNLDALRRGGRV